MHKLADLLGRPDIGWIRTLAGLPEFIWTRSRLTPQHRVASWWWLVWLSGNYTVCGVNCSLMFTSLSSAVLSGVTTLSFVLWLEVVTWVVRAGRLGRQEERWEALLWSPQVEQVWRPGMSGWRPWPYKYHLHPSVFPFILYYPERQFFFLSYFFFSRFSSFVFFHVVICFLTLHMVRIFVSFSSGRCLTNK